MPESSTETPADKHPVKTTLSSWIILFGVWLLYCVFGVVSGSLAPLAALIINDLNLTHSQMGIAMGAWQLVYIVAAIPAGMLLDRIEPRYSLTLGGLLIALSALCRGLADNHLALMGAVMLFGLGGPIISAGAPKVIMQTFASSSRGLAMGIYTTGLSIGVTISLSATHAVVLPLLNHAWQTTLMLWALVTCLSTIIWFVIASLCKNRNNQPAKLQESQLGTTYQLIKKSTVIMILVMGICLFMLTHALNNWLPELLRFHGMSATTAGYWAAIPTLIGIAGALCIPRLATPSRRLTILLLLGLSICLSTWLLRFDNEVLLFTGLVLQGFTRTSLMTVLILTLVELPDIGEKRSGIASGLFFSVVQVGGFLGPLAVGFMVDQTGSFTSGLTLLTLIATVIIPCSIMLKRYARAA